MKTKLLSLVVALFATTAIWSYDFKVGDLYYDIINKTTRSVKVTYQYSGSSDNYKGLTSVTIPTAVTYNGTTYSVTSIDSQTFGSCEGLTSITVPNSVTSIGESAFFGCTGLTSITIPESVTSIESLTFYGCRGLTSITIPECVTSIGKNAFKNVPNIVYNGTATGSPWGARSVNGYVDGYFVYADATKTTLLACYSTVTGAITIPESVTSIGSSAFCDCTGLTSITIHEGVTSIGSRAFYGCTGITSITIPNSVTSIGGGAFRDCTGLTSITIHEGVTSIGNYAFDGCTGLTSITIPESVTSIGNYAFDGCIGLTSITIPNSVTSIGEYAFSGCTGLTSITIPESVTSIGGAAFYDCTGLTSITIPNSVTSIGDNAFEDVPNIVYNGTATGSPWGARSVNGYVDGYFVYADATKTTLLACYSTVTGAITIPESVTSIGSSAFRDCTGLTSITIHEGVTSIGNYAFDGCIGFTSIVWNAKSCMDFTVSPFAGSKKNITSFTFGDAVESIPAYLCYGMSKLDSISIPENVKSIGYHSFADCTGLTSITIPNSVTTIGQYALAGCTSLSSITLPDNITNIDGTFSGCTSLISIKIPNSVTKIGYDAFYNCYSLTSIIIPESVTSIAKTAFSGCTWLVSITLSIVVEDVLYGCTSLSTLVLNGNKACTSSLLYNSSYDIRKQITSLTFTDAVTTIDTSAFAGCSNLETVEFGANVQNIGDKAFSSCQNIYEIRVHASKVPNVVAETASSATDGTFRGVSKLAELYVPSESVKKYKIHPVWGLFNMITAIPYVVTLNCDNVQGAVSGAGSYQANEQVRITASANEGYRFVQWSDGITTNPRTIVVASDTTLTAEFEAIPTTEYTVSVSADADQHGSVQMTLLAVPDAGFHFLQWSDGNTDNPRTIVVNENITLRATFVLATEEVAVNADASAADGTRKFIRNGQVLILHDGKTYTTLGAAVE